MHLAAIPISVFSRFISSYVVILTRTPTVPMSKCELQPFPGRYHAAEPGVETRFARKSVSWDWQGEAAIEKRFEAFKEDAVGAGECTCAVLMFKPQLDGRGMGYRIRKWCYCITMASFVFVDQ